MNKRSGLIFGILLVLMFSIFSFGVANAREMANVNFLSCIDSEVGMNGDSSVLDYLVKGQIHVEYESGGVMASQNIYDECKDTSTLIEYFCKNPLIGTTKPAKSEVSCGVGQTCENGACINTDRGSNSGLANELPLEFFGPNNNYTYYSCTGVVSPPGSPNPGIKESITVEYSDNGGPIQSVTIYDACKKVALGGISSAKETQLWEYWCKVDQYGGVHPTFSFHANCGPGKTCEEGACVGGLVCNETDGGKIYSIYGKASGWDSFDKKYVTYEDQCLSGNTGNEIKEAYCSWTGEVGRESVVCSEGCSNNVCVEPAVEGNTINCTDSDSGIDASITGTVVGLKSIQNSTSWSFTDTCTTEEIMGQTVNVAVEGYCSENGEANTLWVYCPAGCTDGSCDFVAGVSGCADTDNGINYSKMGTVSGTHYGLEGWSLTDTCHRTQNNQEAYLTEGYCENGEAKFINVLCLGECFGGTCNVEGSNITAYDCEDTDFGLNYNVKGTTTGMHEGDPNWVHEDRCYGQNVIEGFCDSFGNVHLVNYGSCENGCDNGACILGDAGIGNNIKTKSLLSYRFTNFVRNMFTNQNSDAQTSNNVNNGAQAGQNKGDKDSGVGGGDEGVGYANQNMNGANEESMDSA